MSTAVSRDRAGSTPTDHGLAALGLIMQLGGAIFLIFTVIETLSYVRPEWFGRDYATSGWLLDFKVLSAAAILRSALHVRAGLALARRTGPTRLYPIYTYIAVALAQSALTLFFLTFGMGRGVENVSTHMLVAAVVLLAWPLTLLAMLIHPRLRRIARELPPAAPNRVPGALMLVLGLIGALAALLMFYAILGPADMRLSLPSVVRFLLGYACALLMARSVLQAIAGARVMSDRDPDSIDRALARYINLGLLSSVLAGVALFLVHLHVRQASHYLEAQLSRRDAWALILLLLCWPLILRCFRGARRSSPPAGQDAGLSSLGWFLLAVGVFQLGIAVLAMFGTQEPWLVDYYGLRGQVHYWLRGVDGGELLQFVTGPRWPWWVAAMVPAQLWAAIEMIHVTRRQRLAATTYGGLSTAITIYLIWPQLQHLEETLTHTYGIVGRTIGLFEISFWLVVPLVTMILASRKPAAPPGLREPVSGQDRDAGAGDRPTVDRMPG